MVSTGTSFNPFPGLRSFETEESYLFFGRETQVEELLQNYKSIDLLQFLGCQEAESHLL
ncbi:MAG: hypothetical protein HC773_19445 [Scytonema sp. CRU_2_7]|nr:hypothetical protein [Scytonema sp. CRU_2_7]